MTAMPVYFPLSSCRIMEKRLAAASLRSSFSLKFKIALDEYFIKIYFETRNGITNLENESEGFNWFFSLFFNTINPNELKKGDIIIIDEPEQHLSVPLIRELREFLKQFARAYSYNRKLPAGLGGFVAN